MQTSTILQAVAILGGLGVFFASVLAFAHTKLYVWEDPRLDVVAGMLPNVNCGACGLAGCRQFAENVVAGRIKPSGCTVSNSDTHAAIADFLGVDAGTADKRVARLLCAGGTDVAVQQADYYGIETCAAAASVQSGGKGCTWGCIGLADCARACTFDAIVMNAAGLPVVDIEKCTSCGDCVTACPKDLFVLQSLREKLLVQCRSLLAGEAATALCRVACNACGRCALDAETGVVAMKGNLPVVNGQLAALASAAATQRCPTNAIVWVEGTQFAPTTSQPAAPRPAAMAV